jgi:hypothetical protein
VIAPYNFGFPAVTKTFDVFAVTDGLRYQSPETNSDHVASFHLIPTNASAFQYEIDHCLYINSCRKYKRLVGQSVGNRVVLTGLASSKAGERFCHGFYNVIRAQNMYPYSSFASFFGIG